MAKTPTSRVDRLLGSMGYGSRAEMARMAKAGGIVLDGVDLTDVSKRIPVTPDLPSRMEIDGQPLDPVQGLVLMLNKPLGMTCSHKEEGALVYDILPGRWRERDPAISTIGRSVILAVTACAVFALVLPVALRRRTVEHDDPGT